MNASLQRCFIERAWVGVFFDEEVVSICQLETKTSLAEGISDPFHELAGESVNLVSDFWVALKKRRSKSASFRMEVLVVQRCTCQGVSDYLLNTPTTQ
jgi:hypothetical protein